MRNLLHALLCTLLFAALAPSAHAATETVQLGGGYQMVVSCEGTRIHLRRVGQGEVLVRCSDRAVRAASPIAPVSATLGEIRLDAGESTRLYCQGDALKTKRKTGSQMRANCLPIAAPAI